MLLKCVAQHYIKMYCRRVEIKFCRNCCTNGNINLMFFVFLNLSRFVFQSPAQPTWQSTSHPRSFSLPELFFRQLQRADAAAEAVEEVLRHDSANERHRLDWTAFAIGEIFKTFIQFSLCVE